MNMLLRLFWIFIRALWQPPCSPLGPVLTPFRVLPTDLDIYLHMNNGKYCSIMDLGRYDLLRRSGLLKSMREAKLVPIISAQTIRFRRPLRGFQRFYVETRVIGWDDRAFLMEQRFLRRSRRDNSFELVAEGVVRAHFLSDKTSIKSAEFLHALGVDGMPSPEMPEWIVTWNARQAQVREAERGLKTALKSPPA